MKAPKSYEEGLSRLNEILNKLSDEATPLDTAVSLYAEAAKLIEFCNNALKNAKIRIEEIDVGLETAKGENDGL